MRNKPYKISLFDKTPVFEGGNAINSFEYSVTIATEAERLGYHRIWLGEHHGAERLAGSAPEILAAWLLSRTSHIRIGSGGVLLQHYSPFKIAEQFRVLSALAPGRVDLGIGKAPGGLPLTTRALSLTGGLHPPADFERKLEELTAFLGDGLPEGHPLFGARAFPAVPEAPQRFLLGAGPASAALAARLGWNFAHAGHFDGDDQSIAGALHAYRSASAGTFVLSVTVVVGSTQFEADALAREINVLRVSLADGRNVNLPTEDAAREFARQAGVTDYTIERRKPLILAGPADQVRAELDRLAALGISEFVLDIVARDHAGRLDAIRSIAAVGERLVAAE
jgi:luciferase family oxidoreductase group 1